MRSRIVLLIIISWLSAALGVSAQSIDYNAFDTFAASVEASIGDANVSDTDLERFRKTLVNWRDDFQQGQDANSVQIEALQAQLDALGPAPAEGATEAADIAARRQTLTDSLQKAREPQISASEAYARADALIGQIDSFLREKQAVELFTLSRTPLDPTLWTGTFASLGTIISAVQKEVADNFAALTDRGQLWQRIAISVLLLGSAFLLIFRGPRWIESLISRIESRSGQHGPIVYGFLLSFGAVVAAMAGISLINAALISTGILGETGRAVAIGINAAILAYAIGRWLGGRIFPERDTIPTSLGLNQHQRASGRAKATYLGGLTGLLSLQGIVSQTVTIDQGHLAVLTFPVFVLIGLVMFRLGRLIWLGGVPAEGEPNGFSNSIERIIGRTVQLVAIAAPLAAAIGFFSLARGVLYPLSLTLALLAFLMALHFVLRAAWAMFRHLDDSAAKLALAPVLASLVVTMAAAPVLWLIWGARTSDLSETWERFKTGIRIGGTSITPGNLLTLAIVFAIGIGVTRLVQGTLRTSVLPRTKIDKGGQNAIISGLGYLGITLAAIVGITSAGIDLSSFAIIIGALGVGIGFGLQNIVNNFVSGIILLIERPIGEGDWVEVGGQMGIVRAISVRSTRIETFDRTDIIVPNGDLISGTVTNWTRGNALGRVILPVGVAYGTDTKKVEAILRDIAEANPIVAVNPPPNVFFIGFGADSMDFEIRAILNDISFGLQVKSDLNHEIARRFAEEGIEIPFAQRDVWLRNPETLSPGNSSPTAPDDPASDQTGAPA